MAVYRQYPAQQPAPSGPATVFDAASKGVFPYPGSSTQFAAYGREVRRYIAGPNGVGALFGVSASGTFPWTGAVQQARWVQRNYVTQPTTAYPTSLYPAPAATFIPPAVFAQPQQRPTFALYQYEAQPQGVDALFGVAAQGVFPWVGITQQARWVARAADYRLPQYAPIATPGVYNDSVSETGSATDTYTSQIAAVGSVSESGAATDTYDSQISAVGAVSESATATDTVSSQISAVGAVSETGAATDTTSSQIGAVGAVSESASATDTYTSQLSAFGTISETATATDLYLADGSSYTDSVSESGSATDAYTATVGGGVGGYKQRRRKIIIKNRVYEVREQDIPAFVEMMLTEPETLKTMPSVVQKVEPKRAPDMTVHIAQERIELATRALRKAEGDVRMMLDQIGRQMIQELQDDEDAAIAVLFG